MEPTTTLKASGLEFSATCVGPNDGAVVVMLHGFPDMPGTFRHQVDALVDAGFRVVVPTLRGYEPSSQPVDGDCSLMALAGDVVGWLDSMGVDRAHVVGHDWGAVIAYVVASQRPERLRSLTTIAIPPLARIPASLRHVPRQLQRSWYMTFFQLGGLADRALRAGDWRLMRRLWATWSPDYVLSTEEWNELRAQFEAPGVVGASLAYYRQNATPPILLGIRTTPAMERRAIEAPTLVIHGTNDGCMDRRLFDHAVVADDFPGGVTVLEIEHAGHFVHLEEPARVNTALLHHLRGSDPPNSGD